MVEGCRTRGSRAVAADACTRLARCRRSHRPSVQRDHTRIGADDGGRGRIDRGIAAPGPCRHQAVQAPGVVRVHAVWPTICPLISHFARPKMPIRGLSAHQGTSAMTFIGAESPIGYQLLWLPMLTTTTCGGNWLARKDSNLQSPDPESGALPLGHSPAAQGEILAEWRACGPSRTSLTLGVWRWCALRTLVRQVLPRVLWFFADTT